jgi:hypothetical protein
MSMKTILVPMENLDALQSAPETVLLLARRYYSHMEGFALRWQINKVASLDRSKTLPHSVGRASCRASGERDKLTSNLAARGISNQCQLINLRNIYTVTFWGSIALSGEAESLCSFCDLPLMIR